MTIDPRIGILAEPSTSGFAPTRQALLAPGAKRRELFQASCILLEPLVGREGGGQEMAAKRSPDLVRQKPP